MAPIRDSESGYGMMEWKAASAAVVAIGLVLSTLMAWILCGCGGKKEAEKEPESPAEPAATTVDLVSNKPESVAKTATTPEAPAPAATAVVTPKDTTQKPQLANATEKRSVCGPEMKRAAVPTTGAVSGEHPAYQTLMNDNDFKASTKPMKGMDKVAGSHPAYQTLMNDANFEPSNKGKSVAKSPAAETKLKTGTKSMASGSIMKGTTTFGAKTAMAGPSERQQTMLQTARAPSGDSTKK